MMNDPRKFYFLCSIQRSGSTLVSYVLQRIGALGLPDEFVSQGSEHYWSHDPQDFFKRLLTERTANGVFGMKAHFYEFMSIYLSKYREIFKDPQYFYLTRDNKLDQAISLVKAEEQTFWNTVSYAAPDREIDYDYDKIQRALHFILAQEHGWQAFFAANGIEPYRFSYEEFLRDPVSICREMGRRLGIPLDLDHIDLDQGPLRRQSNSTNAQWRERFIADSRERMERPNIDAYLGMEGMVRWSYRDPTGHDYLLARGLPFLHSHDPQRRSDQLQAQEHLKHLGYLTGEPEPFVHREAANAAIAYQKDHGYLVDPRLLPTFTRKVLIDQADPSWMAGDWVEHTNAEARRNGGGVRVTVTEEGLHLDSHYIRDDGSRIGWTATLRRVADFEYTGLAVHEPDLRALGWLDATLHLRMWRDEAELSGTHTPIGSHPYQIVLRQKNRNTGRTA